MEGPLMDYKAIKWKDGVEQHILILPKYNPTDFLLFQKEKYIFIKVQSHCYHHNQWWSLDQKNNLPDIMTSKHECITYTVLPRTFNWSLIEPLNFQFTGNIRARETG